METKKFYQHFTLKQTMFVSAYSQTGKQKIRSLRDRNIQKNYQHSENIMPALMSITRSIAVCSLL